MRNFSPAALMAASSSAREFPVCLDDNRLRLVVGVGIGDAGELQELGFDGCVAVSAHESLGGDTVVHG